VIKYKVSTFGKQVEFHEISREDDRFVYFRIDGRECNTYKESPGWKWFNTYEEAYAYLLKLAEEQYAIAVRHVDQTKRHLESVKAMVNPETAQ